MTALCFVCKVRPCAVYVAHGVSQVSALCGSPACDAAMTKAAIDGARNAERIGLAPAGFALQVQGRLRPF
jgi:hypothetical protein